MRETPEEVAGFRALLDRTMADVNPHFASIVTKKNRLTAQQVCAYLQGTRIVAFSTVTQGRPRVSPAGQPLPPHGRFTLSHRAGGDRIGHLRANPSLSAVYLEGDKVAVVVNGAVE